MNVYLDYAATTPLGGEVLEEMLPLLKENFGNPDSLHSYGRSAAQAVTRARDRIAEALAVKSSEVYFTSGGTEADNWAVQKIGRGSVCVSAIEHSAALSAADLRAGGKSVARSNAGGIVTAEAVKSALSEHTGLACSTRLPPFTEAPFARSRPKGLLRPTASAARSRRRRDLSA